MKKFLALILALTMVMGMATMVAADTINAIDGTASGNVTVHVTPGSATVYNIEVEWTDMEFTYNFGADATWNPEGHKYENGTGAAWTDPDATVSVVNHSNADVTATVTFDDGTKTKTVNEVVVTIADANSKVLKSAVNYADAATVADQHDDIKLVVNLTASGVPTVEADFNFGTVKVTISNVTP